MLSDPVLKTIRLHRPPVSVVQIRRAMRSNPDNFPKGSLCAYCSRQGEWFVAEMWPVEFVYLMPGNFLHSQWVYTCCEAHAAMYMLSWWQDPPEEEFGLDVPAAI